jgi:iron complex outermembrane receptor protein/vitamin B12 transporter
MPAHPCATRLLPLVLAAMSGLALLQAHAASSDADIVVTGTRLPMTSSGLAQNVTVIEHAEILASNPSGIEDVLSRVTGIYVDQAGSAGGFMSMYLRGAENSHLLILLDGVRLNDPTTTRGSTYDLSSIDVNQIERIEVLRGPASAVYGGEALAGVIHFITRRAAVNGIDGSGYMAVGGDDERSYGALLNLGNGSLQAQLNAGHIESGESGDDATLDLDSASGSLRLVDTGWFTAGVFAGRVERDSEGFPDDSGGPRLAVNRELTDRTSTDRRYGADIRLGGSDDLQLQLAASVFDRDARDDNAAIDAGQRFPVPAFVTDTGFKRRDLSLVLNRNWGPELAIVAGAEFADEDGQLASRGDFLGTGSPQTLDFSLDRETSSLFLEARFPLLAGVGAQLGLRHDEVDEGDDSDRETTPHLGLVWELPDAATTLKANYNEGFKPPSFFALGFPLGGNPALEPEHSKNMDLILARRLDAAGSVVQLSVFKTRYKDLVDFDSDTFTNINRGTIVVQGIEPELRLRLDRHWHVQANASLLDIDERDGLQPLRNRPERTAALSLTRDFDAGHTAFIGLAYSGDFLDRSNPTGDIRMSSFTVVNAAGSLRFGPLRVSLGIDNLLDEDYEQFVGFPAQDRRLRLELRGDF